MPGNMHPMNWNQTLIKSHARAFSVCSSLSARASRHLVGLVLQFTQRMRAALEKPAAAPVLDAYAARKAHFAPFCQVACASGAQWACDGQGYFQLLEPQGAKQQAAVLEFLEHLGPPAGVSVADTWKQSIYLHLPELYQIGLHCR